MRVERASWLIACLVLVVLVGHFKYERDELERAFLVSPLDRDLETAALAHMARREGSSQAWRDYFYVGHAYLSDRDCIRFVPKRYVRGGGPTYCFAKSRPVRLVSVDYGNE